MNNCDLSQLNIDFLKAQLLIGNYKSTINENKKGKELEKIFKYLLIQPENGGKNIKDIEDNQSLFNCNKIPRSFEVSMAGFVLLKQNEESIQHISEISSGNKNYYICELKNYDFYNQNNVEEFKYGEIKIKYNIKQKKFSKGKKKINFDLCSDLKDISKIKMSSIKSGSNIFKKAASIIQNDKDQIEDKIKKKEIKDINEDDYIIYLSQIISFSEYIKNKFNANQNRYPNIIKFSQLKKHKNIFFFHLILIREIDAAFQVINDYNFAKYAEIKEFNIKENSKKIFKKNDILLFEIKDTSMEYTCLECITYNYNVINGYIKTLKKNNEFKDNNFYYMLLQENKGKKNPNLYMNLLNDLRTKIQDNLLVHYYLFEDRRLFGKDFSKMNPRKLEILYLLKEEISFFKEKMRNIEMKFDIIIILLIILIARLLFVIFKK